MAKVASKSVLLDGDVPVGMEFSFTNGRKHKVLLTDLDKSLLPFAAVHGLSQKLGDAYSQAGGSADTAETLFLAQLEILKGGSWNKGERGSAVADEDLAQALAIVTKQPVEVARERVREEDKAWKDARRKHPLVAAEIARLQAERKAKKAEAADADTDGLL